MCIRDRAEGVGRARDRALGVQPLGAIGIQLLIAIAADGGEDTREGGLLVQDEVGAQAYSSAVSYTHLDVYKRQARLHSLSFQTYMSHCFQDNKHFI